MADKTELDEKIGRIKEFWGESAKTHRTDPTATLGDPMLRDIEVREILKRVRHGQKLLDCGCGNGTSTIQIAKRRRVDLTGLDYSEEMIEMAERNLENDRNSLMGNVRFQVGDILKLDYAEGTFDTVITMRCLQNLPCFELQKQAIISIQRILKREGSLLMLECSNDGLRKLNALLTVLRKPPMIPPWHNLFFNDADLRVLSRDVGFPMVEVVNVSGVYQFLALCLNYRIRSLGKFLPSFLDTGYHKLYVWEKR